MRGLAIEGLGNPSSPVEQILRLGDVELRIGPQEVVKSFQVPLKADLLHDGLHFAAQLGNFIEAQLVYGFRRHV